VIEWVYGGLLPYLQHITFDIHINTLSGESVAANGYCWKHKGAVLCAENIHGELNFPYGFSHTLVKF